MSGSASARVRRYSEQPRLLGEWLRVDHSRSAVIRAVGDKFHVTMKRRIGDASGEGATVGAAIAKAFESCAQFIEWEAIPPMAGMTITGISTGSDRRA